VRSVNDVNDVNRTEAIIRAGTDAAAAGLELASAPDHPSCRTIGCARCPSFARPLTGPEGRRRTVLVLLDAAAVAFSLRGRR
jgi:hypothetical protein